MKKIIKTIFTFVILFAISFTLISIEVSADSYEGKLQTNQDVSSFFNADDYTNYDELANTRYDRSKSSAINYDNRIAEKYVTTKKIDGITYNVTKKKVYTYIFIEDTYGNVCVYSSSSVEHVKGLTEETIKIGATESTSQELSASLGLGLSAKLYGVKFGFDASSGVGYVYSSGITTSQTIVIKKDTFNSAYYNANLYKDYVKYKKVEIVEYKLSCEEKWSRGFFGINRKKTQDAFDGYYYEYLRSPQSASIVDVTTFRVGTNKVEIAG